MLFWILVSEDIFCIIISSINNKKGINSLMDQDGGFDPNAQTDYDPRLYVAPQSQPQQVPVSGQEAAYSSNDVSAAAVQVAQYASETLPGQPIQDVRPGWQQDLQYSATVDPPWVQDTAAASYGQNIQSNSGAIHSPPIAPEAYSLLTDPMDEFSQLNSVKSPKSVLRKLLIAMVLIGVLSGSSFGAYTIGYRRGTSNKVATVQTETISNDQQDAQNEKSLADKEVVEPELNFQLVKPDYKDGITDGTIGKQVVSSDGLVVNVYRVDDTYKPELAQDAVDTSKYIKVDLLLGNADDLRPKTILKSTFNLVDESGQAVEPLDTEADGLNAAQSVTLSPGTKARMSLVFPTQEGQSFRVEWSQVYQVSGTQRIIGVSISLE